MVQARIQRLHHFGRGAFLRPEHGRCAFFAAHWVIHIAGHHDFHAGQALIQAAKVDCGQILQTAAAGTDGLMLRIQQQSAQRLQHAGTAVVGGAAADADNDFFHALGQRGQNQFAGAVACGAQRVARFGRHQMQARCGGHFDNGGAPVAREAEFSLHFVAQRRAHFCAYQSAFGGIHQRLHRALAAIGHRHFHIFGIGQHFFQAGFNGLGHFQRG